MTSATSERGLKAAKARQKQDVEVNRTVITTLMSTIAGRRWIWLQLEFAQIFTGNDDVEAMSMAFEKGRRNTGLKLLSEVLSIAPENFVRMQQENSGVKLIEEDERDGGPSE